MPDVVFDATHPLDPAAVRAAHGVAVARYLDAGFDSKAKQWMTAAEVTNYRKVGLGIMPIYEIGTADVLAGRAVAETRARGCLTALEAIGLAGAPVWWTADRDLILADKDRAVEYARGWSTILGSGRRGVYGDADLLKWLAEADLMDWGWQAAAQSWSGYAISPHAHLVQQATTVAVGGVQADTNTIRRTPFGAWTGPAQKEPDVTITAADLAAHAKSLGVHRFAIAGSIAQWFTQPGVTEPGTRRWIRNPQEIKDLGLEEIPAITVPASHTLAQLTPVGEQPA